jgi:hypothetical protein
MTDLLEAHPAKNKPAFNKSNIRLIPIDWCAYIPPGLEAQSVRDCEGGTIGCVALFENGSIVLAAESSYLRFGGATPIHTHVSGTELEAESTCMCFGGAARMHTHSLCTPNVLGAESSYNCSRGAAWMHVHSLCTPTVLKAESTCVCVGGAGC